MHYLYIIHSPTLDSYYVGESPDIQRRLKQHNEHYFKSSFTKGATDWQISMKYDCANRAEALFLEKFIKKMKSRVFIEKVVDNPKILSDILKRNSP